MIELPVELWDTIATMADHEDLFKLALVSRILLQSCRRILARSLILDIKHRRNYDEVFSFLVRTNLVACIRAVYIRRFDPGKLAGCIPFDKMLNLQHLMIADMQPRFFLSAEFQQDVVRQLRCCHNLRELVYLNWYRERSLPHDEFSVSRLGVLEWRDDGKLQPAFFSLSAASSSTIRCLKIHATMPIFEHEHYSRLFNMQFPVLETLDIGPGCHSISGATVSDPVRGQLARQFSKFLIAHSTITSLTLSYDDDIGREAYIPFDESVLSSNILPNLEILNAYPSQVTQFVSVNADFLRKLSTLSIRETESGDMEHVLRLMFRAIQELKNAVGPLGLRHLTLAFNNNMHDCLQLCKTWLDTCADAFPLLETYMGETYRSSAMYDQFPNFQRLRVITCTVRRKKWRSQYAHAIAKNCPSLEKIESFRGRLIFDIKRGPDGEVAVSASSEHGQVINTEDELTSTDDSDFESDSTDNEDENRGEIDEAGYSDEDTDDLSTDEDTHSA